MKKLFRILAIISFIAIFLSCDALNNGDSSDGGSIVGQWKDNSSVVGLRLTTNTNQTATNFLNSVGEISITGDYNSKITLLLKMTDSETGDESIIIADVGGFVGTEDTSYVLLIDHTGADHTGVLQVSTSDGTDYADQLTNPVDYLYDGVNLTITNSMLSNPNTLTSVNISGTISLDVVNIIPNTPTPLNFQADQFYTFGNTISTFNDDSTFSSSDGPVPDDQGTWLIVGDSLLLTMPISEEDLNTGEISTTDTTLSFYYVNNGNEFIISQSYNLCAEFATNEDEIDCADLLAFIENYFNLDIGSISEAELEYEIVFMKIDSGNITKPSINTRPIKWNPLSQALIEKIINYK